eukprot:2616736-Pleurochrysis_carterae.AAC.3
MMWTDALPFGPCAPCMSAACLRETVSCGTTRSASCRFRPARSRKEARRPERARAKHGRGSTKALAGLNGGTGGLMAGGWRARGREIAWGGVAE